MMSDTYVDGLIEAIDDAIGETYKLLEATAEERRAKRKRDAAALLLLLARKRKRDLALAIGLIGQGTAGALAAASALPKNTKAKLRRKLDVVAFGATGPRGAPTEPVAIAPGDTLYLSPVDQPGAGLVSKDATRIPYATALDGLAAGVKGAIRATLWEKLWLTDGRPCEVCELNSIAGWIPMDKSFPSGDWEPKAHPNCKCSLETRQV